MIAMQLLLPGTRPTQWTRLP